MSIHRAKHPCPEDRDYIECDFCHRTRNITAFEDGADGFTLIATVGDPEEHYCDDCESRVIGHMLREERRKIALEQSMELTSCPYCKMQRHGQCLDSGGNNCACALHGHKLVKQPEKANSSRSASVTEKDA